MDFKELQSCWLVKIMVVLQESILKSQNVWSVPFNFQLIFQLLLEQNQDTISLAENDPPKIVSAISNIPMICDDPNGACTATFAVVQSDTDLLVSTCQISFATNGSLHIVEQQNFSIVAARDFVDDGDRDVSIEFQLISVDGCSEWLNYSQPIPDTNLVQNSLSLPLNVSEWWKYL